VSERPLLGTLSMAQNDATRQKNKRDLTLFLGGLAGLAASFAGVLVLGLLMARAA
jgi:uncharacterized protein involved in exopolysaccharide biosynthesis